MTVYALIVDFCDSGGNYDGSSESLDAGFGVVGLVFIIVMLVTELYKSSNCTQHNRFKFNVYCRLNRYTHQKNK